MGLNAGEVYAILGGVFDPKAFVAFDGAIKKSAAQAAAGEKQIAASNKRSAASMAALGTVAKTGAAVGVAALGAAIVGSVKVAADFEKQLSGLKAVTNANAKEMGALEKQALQFGKSTAFGAREVVQAQTELAKGGVATSDILKGALSASLSLAAAGELELADAAATVANAMNLFGIEAGKAGTVSNTLAAAANLTTADVGDFALALTQGGAAARQAGLSFNQTVVWLEMLAAAGVKGSDAGTSMKAALTQLASPSKESAELQKKLGLSFFDSAGNMKSTGQNAEQLRDKLKGMTAEQRLATLTTLAGTDGMRALSALFTGGAASAREFGAANQQLGQDAEMAREKQNNLAGDLEKLGGAAETAAITLGQKVTPAIRDFTQDLTEALEGIDPKTFEDIGQGVADAVNAAGDGVDLSFDIGGKISDAIGEIRDVPVLGDIFDQAFKIDSTIALGPLVAIKGAIGDIRDSAQQVGPAIGAGLTSGISAAGDKILGLASTILDTLADVTEAGNNITPGSIGDIDTGGIRDAQKDIDELRERIRTPLNLRFNLQDGSRAEKNIRSLIGQMEDVGKKKVAIKIANNAPDAESAMAGLAAAVSGIPTSWITKIQQNAPSSRVQIMAYTAALAGVPRSKISSIITNARSEAGAVAGLQGQINSLQGKTVNVGVTISGSGKALKALGWADGRGAGDSQTGLVGEAPGERPEWLVNRRTGAAMKTDGPALVNLGPDDYVIPTDPRRRGRGLDLLGMLAADLGIEAFAKGKAPKKKSKGKAKKKRFIPTQQQIFRADPDDLEQVADNATQRLDDAKRASEEKDRKGKLTKNARKAKNRLPELRAEARRRRQIAREAKRYADRIEAADEQADIARNDMVLADNRDDQKGYDKAKKSRGAAISRATKLLQAALAKAPKNSAWARELQKRLGDTKVAADENRAEQMEVEEVEETEAQKAAREAAERLGDTGMTDAERAVLEQLEANVSLAGLTQGLDDDKAAAASKTSFLEGILGMVMADPARGGAGAIRDVADAVKSARENLASLTGQGGAVNESADVQAQIEQARQAGFAAGQGGRIDAASAAAFGSGQPNITIQTLHPGDSRTLDAIGAAATQGIGQQPYRRASRERSGL